MDRKAGRVKKSEPKLEDLEKCYLFISRSSYVLEEEVNRIKKIFGGKINFDTDFRVFDASSEIDEYDFRNFMSTPSFFSTSKLLVVKNVERLPSHLLDVLIDKLEESKDIVFVLTSTKSKPGSKLMELVERIGKVEDIKSPPATELKKWLEEKSELDGIKFTTKASNLLLESVGEDLTSLKLEYEKLHTYVISEKEKLIDEKIAKSLISRTYFLKVFDLVDFVGVKDKRNSLKALKDMIDGKQSLIGMVTLLYRMFKCLMYLKYENGRRSVKDYLRKNISAKEYFIDELVRKYEKFSKNYSEEDIIRIFGILNHYDIQFRKATIEESINLANMLILEILED